MTNPTTSDGIQRSHGGLARASCCRLAVIARNFLHINTCWLGESVLMGSPTSPLPQRCPHVRGVVCVDEDGVKKIKVDVVPTR